MSKQTLQNTSSFHSRRSLAALCALLLVVAVMAAHPVVEAGIIDDFSYIRSAKTLAETGHIAYY